MAGQVGVSADSDRHDKSVSEASQETAALTRGPEEEDELLEVARGAVF